MSLRMRLIISFMLVVVLCLCIAAVAVTAVFQSSRDRLTTTRLNDMARPIYVQIMTLAREQKPRGEIIASLQEQAQEKARITPTYQVIKEWGPDHAKHFVVGVFLDKEKVAEGEGSSKQEAEAKAAESGLSAKNWQ